MIIGLTGGSGTGKSEASRFFAEHGFTVIDMDKVSREVCRAGEPCLDEIVKHFGKGILNPDGTLNRHGLGDMVFSNPDKLTILNAVTHKYIIAETNRRIAHGGNFVLDAAVLFEAGMDSICDVTVAVVADKDTRIKRIMKRDALTYEQAKNRIEAQHSDEWYRERCTYIVVNNSTQNELYRLLSELFGGSYVEKAK